MIKLSPSQSKILACLKSGKDSYGFPKAPLRFDNIAYFDWAYSWEIVQHCKTADYRRRIHELRKLGYKIISFEVSQNGIRRHGFILVFEPQEEKRVA